MSRSPARTAEAGGNPWLEAALVLAVALALRLAFVTAFPTMPVSDFRALVDFGIYFRDRSIFAGGWFWDLLNPGLPLLVSLLTRLLPWDPAVVMRLATAVATSLLAPLPVVLWRLRPRRVRLTAGVLLAVWPGQVAFSGVVAQDNWVLLPAVALACLAVSGLRGERPRPVAAGLLYAAGAAVRQEMLVVLLPLAVAAALGPRGLRARRLLLAALVAAAPLLLLALQREAATGRFALSSEHGGTTMLGSFVPGATANGWADPIPHVAAVAPHLLEDLPRLRREAAGLALEEAAARPGFHAARITALTLDTLLRGEVNNLAWSLSGAGVLEDPAAQRRAQAIGRPLTTLLSWELGVLTAAALLAGAILSMAGQRAHLPLLAAIALKVGIHALTVVQGRYFLTVTAFMVLLVALGVEGVGQVAWRRVWAAGAAAAALVVAGSLLSSRLLARVHAADVEPERSYSFALGMPGAAPALSCTVGPGRLTVFDPPRRAVVTLAPGRRTEGTRALVRCRPRRGEPVEELVLRLHGDLAGRAGAGLDQRVTVAGRELWRRAGGAEPGRWQEVDLGEVWAAGHEVAVELTATGAGSAPVSPAPLVTLELGVDSAAPP